MSPEWLEHFPRETIALPPAERPILQIVVDTEEEFDWQADFDRHATSVEAMTVIERAQKVFEEFDLRPTYVVDFPVASQPAGYTPLKKILDSGRAEIGVHLHPWVSPPFEEEICAHNSYAGNLPPELESAKLERLVEQTMATFAKRPVIYKAGRYGFGPNTPMILEELEFEVDLSFCPAFDFTSDGGPDYSQVTTEPYWFGNRRRLLGLPTTGAFVGSLARWGRWLYSLSFKPKLGWIGLPGIFSRLGLMDRLLLSPEGFDLAEMRRLTRDLLLQGTRIFTFSFHSPSLKPGCTPYVRSDSDLESLISNFRRYFDYFLGELEGRNMTPLEIKRYLERPLEGVQK